jgi:hypothetical protein
MRHHVEPLLPLCQCSSTSKIGSVKCNDTMNYDKFRSILFYVLHEKCYREDKGRTNHFNIVLLTLLLPASVHEDQVPCSHTG